VANGQIHREDEQKSGTIGTMGNARKTVVWRSMAATAAPASATEAAHYFALRLRIGLRSALPSRA
jgi:hypothetical protein